MRQLSNLVLTLLFLSLANFASAGVNVWTTNGPEGGDIRALAIDPSSPATLYAATSSGGVFKSINGGGRWAPMNAGLTNTFVGSLVIDPSTPRTLYAGTTEGGVFKSTNGGESWTATGLASAIVSALAIDPSSPATIYAGTEGGGVFKSINGGGSWAAINSGLTNPGYIGVYALAIDPATPATLYAGTCGYENEGGLFKSTNGGGSWTAIFAPCIRTLLIDPTAPATIYAGTQLTDGAVHKSTDGGASWTNISEGLTRPPEGVSLALHPSAPTTVYAASAYGIFKSTNGGTSWTTINTGLTNSIFPPTLAIDPSAPATLYAGTNRGVFKSTGGGAGWNASNAGLTATGVNAVVIDPSLPATLYAGTTEGGVFKSTNGGTTWTAVNAGLVPEFTTTSNLTVRALAIDPTNPATLYAGTGGGLAGIRKSTNGGASWTAVNTGLTFDLFFSLAIDPTNPATIYAGTFGSSDQIGIFKSTNGGGNWTGISIGLTNIVVSALAIDPSAPETLYAGTRGGGVLKSTNGGTGLTAINTGLTNSDVHALAIDPSAPATLYAGTSGGVFKSTNRGGDWTAISTGLANTVVFALAIDPSAPETLYAGTRGGGVFKSTNAGSTWTAFNAGLHNPTVNALAIDPVVPTRLYAGTGGGVFEYLTSEVLDRRILPVVGSTPGANGTFFRTSVQLNNPSTTPATGRIVFHTSGVAGSDTDPALAYSLTAGQTQSIADLLPAMGVSGLGSADIEITSGAAPVATARVFNDAGASGTTGFTEAAMRAEEALRLGQTGVLMIPPDFTVARFNVGVRTLEKGASVTFALKDAAGAAVGSTTRVFPTNYHEQQDAVGFLGVFEAPPGGSISITVNSGAAILYGATVDNRTGDPSLQIASARQ